MPALVRRRPLTAAVLAASAGYWLYAMAMQPGLEARTAARLRARVRARP